MPIQKFVSLWLVVFVVQTKVFMLFECICWRKIKFLQCSDIKIKFENGCVSFNKSWENMYLIFNTKTSVCLINSDSVADSMEGNVE